MPITNSEKYYGTVILRLISHLGVKLPKVKFSISGGDSNSAFIIEGNSPSLIGKGSYSTAGLFIKISNKRLSPWRYTFLKRHQDEIAQLHKRFGQVFIAFVCGDDGIACVDFDELKSILDEHHEEQEWVSVSRKLNQNYRMKGNDGTYLKSLSRANFPNNFSDYFSKKLK
jgi:hypothetical protein